MIALFDSLNGYTISRHRTLEAAVLAHRRHAKAVRRRNGPNSYIPVEYIDTRTKKRVDPDSLTRARLCCDCDADRAWSSRQ